MSRLALFDLDNPLLSGDSELLRLDFLLHRGVLEQCFAARNAETKPRYLSPGASTALVDIDPPPSIGR